MYGAACARAQQHEVTRRVVIGANGRHQLKHHVSRQYTPPTTKLGHPSLHSRALRTATKLIYPRHTLHYLDTPRKSTKGKETDSVRFGYDEKTGYWRVRQTIGQSCHDAWRCLDLID